MKKVAVLIILIVIIGAIFYFWQENKKPQNWEHNPEMPKHWTVNIDDIGSLEFSSFDPSSLATITGSLSEEYGFMYEYEDYGEMGVLIDQIGDHKNGEDNKYWQFFVKGEQPQISADKYFPESGTTIDWKFQESEF